MLELLEKRFHENMTRHPGLDWETVEQRLREDPDALEILRRMEEIPRKLGLNRTFPSGKSKSALGTPVKTPVLLNSFHYLPDRRA